MTPSVSILMPVYNDAPYLEEALDSMLGQTLTDFELIVVDDGSSDESWGIIERYAQSDSRIVPIRHGENTGIVGALNDALTRARAPLVARMDGDDRCPPERLERQKAYLDAHPEVTVLGTDLRFIAPDGGELAVRRYPPAGNDLTVKSPVAHGTVMARTDAIRRAGRYDPRFDGAEDYDLWLRMHLRGARFAVLPEVLYDYRLHPQATKARRTKDQLQKTIRTKSHARSAYGYRLGPRGWARLVLERLLALLPARAILALFRLVEVRR